MSGGGSTPAPAPSTTTQIQDIPPWEQGYVTSLLGQAQGVAAQPFQQFPGQQIAGFTPDQTNAFSDVENAPSAYAPLQAAAANSATGGGAAAGNIYGAGSPLIAAGAGAATPGGIQSYMSPYLDSAVQGTVNAANENWNQNIMPSVNNEFIGSGQYASGRNSQVLGQAGNQEQTNLEGQVANLENAGYSQASTNAQNEAGNLLSAGNSLGNLEATQAGQQNANAATSGNLAAQTAATNLTQDQALQAVGQEQQGLEQTNLNTAQQNWQNQVNYPAQQTEYLNQIIRGLPASSATTSASQTTPLGVYSPSPLSGVGGSGVAGLAALAGSNNTATAPNTGPLKKGGLIKGYAAGGLIDDAGDDPTANPLDLSALDGNYDPAEHDPYARGAGSDNITPNEPAPQEAPPPLAAAQRPTASATPPDYSSMPSAEKRPLDGERANPLSASGDGGAFKGMSEGDMQKYQLLALARGMLSPTHTGSPWESLGNSIGAASDTMLQQQQYNQKQQQLAFEKNLELNKLGLQKEQIEQGRYQPIKDIFGNVTGALEGKSGKVLPLSVPGQSGGAGAGQGSVYDSMSPSMQKEVDGIIAGKIMPPNPSSRAPGAQALLAAAAEKDPTFDAVNYQARAKTRSSFVAGPDAANIAAINTAIPHLVALKNSYDKLNNGNYPWLNSAENWVGNKFGNKNTQANTAAVSTDATAVAHELAKVFRNTGMSEAEIRDWQDKIDTSAAPASSNQVIKSALDLMDGRLQALGDKYNQGMGTTKQPLELLSPSSQTAYAKLRDAGSGTPQPATPQSNGPSDAKVTTQAELADLAQKRGVSIDDVTKAAKAKGYTIQ